MTSLGPPRRWTKRHQRLLWTGAAANGALILALIGFAGNGNDKMAALRMITTPVMIGIVGFSFGGVAIIHGSARLAERLFEPAARAKITMANQMLGSFREVLTTPPMDANFARLVWGDQADQKMRELLRGPAKGGAGRYRQKPGDVRGSDAGAERLSRQGGGSPASGAAVAVRLIRGSGVGRRGAAFPSLGRQTGGYRSPRCRPCRGPGSGAQSQSACRTCGLASVSRRRADLQAVGAELEGAASVGDGGDGP